MIRSKHILLVDNNPDSARTVKSLLQSNDYRVDITSTGFDTLTKAQRRPDLILLDLNLPDVDGLELCREMRNNKKYRDIPIIILSSRDSVAEKVEGLYIGADDYITKPFNNEELIARIEVVLRRSHFFEQAKEDKEVLILELRKILKEELITTLFQPIFLLDTYEPLGFEILSRPPVQGRLNNPEFMFKAALAFGMYFDLEILCWRRAFKKWRTSVKKGKLFLNCTPYLIEDKKFDEKIFKKEDIDPNCVVLEITERMAIQDFVLFFKKLEKIRKSGVQLAVDDVGNGYASLDTIAEAKPNYVKIDMPLIRNIHIDPLKQNIVEAVISFCKKSNIITISEGVEEEEELRKIKELNIDAAQGFLLARPAKEFKYKSDMCV